jgi:hypothetical protein
MVCCHCSRYKNERLHQSSPVGLRWANHRPTPVNELTETSFDSSSSYHSSKRASAKVWRLWVLSERPKSLPGWCEPSKILS